MKKFGTQIHENQYVVANWINDFNLTLHKDHKLEVTHPKYLDNFSHRFKK